MAAAMQLPLYRKEITGTPKNIGSEYKYETGDEVEDLFYLLSSIKLQNPEVEGRFFGDFRHLTQNLRRFCRSHSQQISKRSSRECLSTIGSQTFVLFVESRSAGKMLKLAIILTHRLGAVRRHDSGRN